jgi:hypothetical protein
MSDHVKGTCGVREERGNGFDGWWEDRSPAEKVFLVVGLVILATGLLFLFGLVTMALWNLLMPEIFGLKPLTYWQAWGVLALSCIVFGKIGGGGSSDKSDRKRRQDVRGRGREARSDSGRASTLSPTA